MCLVLKSNVDNNKSDKLLLNHKSLKKPILHLFYDGRIMLLWRNFSKNHVEGYEDAIVVLGNYPCEQLEIKIGHCFKSEYEHFYPAVSSDIAELKDMVRALILDKKNQSPAPAPVKEFRRKLCNCGINQPPTLQAPPYHAPIPPAPELLEIPENGIPLYLDLMIDFSLPSFTPLGGMEISDLELKDLPSHLEYAFLEGDDKLPVIIAKNLKDEDKTALIKEMSTIAFWERGGIFSRILSDPIDPLDQEVGSVTALREFAILANDFWLCNAGQVPKVYGSNFQDMIVKNLE
ncbi:hypothetical protein Tco_0558461 [Tanacetum coccineum]